MRALCLVAAAACSPHIASGAYLCGPEQSCPDEQLCNGPDNKCVAPSLAQAFDCTEDFPNPFNDDSAATGTQLAGLQCVSGVSTSPGCLTDEDPGDWYQFDTPAACAAVGVDVIVTFPLAFEPIALQLSTDDGAPVAVDTPCKNPPPPEIGEDARCVAMPLVPGHHYAIGVLHAGDAACDGRCAHNRYTFKLQLVTP
jgi:hypothetical protein